MKSQPLLGTMVLILALASGNVSAAGRPTNLDIFERQLDTLSAKVASVLRNDNVTSLMLESGSRSADMFVRQNLLEHLLNDKFTVLNDSATASVVRVGVPLMEVSYSAPVKSHIFGASDVLRSMRSEYDVEISDSGRVAFAKSFAMSFQDTVSESEIPELEVGSYGFLHGRIESTAFLDTVFQPVLFVASAAVIVYLFFTLRGT